MFMSHFLQTWNSPIISGSFAKNDLQLQASYESSPPCNKLLQIFPMHFSGILFRFSFVFIALLCTSGLCVLKGRFPCPTNWHSLYIDQTSVWKNFQRTATHCNTLQHTATHCNTLQHTATHCYTMQHTKHTGRLCGVERGSERTFSTYNQLRLVYVVSEWEASGERVFYPVFTLLFYLYQ